MSQIKILLVDDHEVVRLGLKSLLSNIPEFHVVGEAGSADEALRLTRGLAPDVVVMDVRMPGVNGIEACRMIRSEMPDVKVIMLTSYSDEEAVFASVMAGASGYVLKKIGGRELIEGIKSVAQGGSLLDPTVTGQVLQRMRGMSGEDGAGDADSPEPLTPQERRIVARIAEGLTNREIAKELHLSEKTIRNYVSNILSKLNLSNRAQAAAYAVREKIVDA